MAEWITVSALNRYVRSVLEGDENLADVAIKGDISNYNCHFKTGHCYFSLIYDDASVKAVMFRSDASELSFQPKNGMSVVARGRVSLYERDGAFQLYVDAMFPAGVGLAQLAFEQLKQRLAQEGLFAVEHKRLIPAFAQCVGIVTSKTGAALQDILQVAGRRCPEAELLLAPVRVQGADAAPDIVAAIRKLDESGLPDVIIVARGGGSSEDLAVFNDETIARAVYGCQTPVISAVGHEIDFTILDFVADLRAPTPSAAAELALPDMTEKVRMAVHAFAQIQKMMQNKLDVCYNQFVRTRQNVDILSMERQVKQRAHKLGSVRDALQDHMAGRMRQEAGRLGSVAALAAGLNPYAVLARGYAIPCQEGRALRSAGEANVGESMDVLMHDGVVRTHVQEIDLQARIQEKPDGKT